MGAGGAAKLVAVAGATGNCGTEILRAAHARGLRVRALVRNEAKLASVRDCCDEVRIVQVTQAETLEGSLDGADYLVSALGKTYQKDKVKRRAVDLDANLHLFTEAKRAGVARVGFVSVFTASPDHPSVMVRMKAEAEACLRASGVPFVILRPSGFFSDMWTLFEMAKKGTLWAIGDADMSFNPIALPDLGEFIVEAMLADGSEGQALDVGGPEILTPRQIAEMSARILDRKVRVRSMPLWLAKAGTACMRPFSRNSWEVAQFLVSNADYAHRHGDAFVAPKAGHRRLEDYLRRRHAEHDETQAPDR